MLELEALRRALHLLAQLRQHLVVLALYEPDQFLDRARVVGLRHRADTRPRAPLDVIEQARPLVRLGHVQRAGAELEEALEVLDRVAQRLGVGIGSEVACPIIRDPARGVDTRVVVGHADLEIEILLIVAQLDVVARTVLLEQVALQQERLFLRAGDDVVEVGDLRHHRADLGGQVGLAAEVGPHAVAQHGRLADVDDASVCPLHEVHAWLAGQIPEHRRQPFSRDEARRFGVVGVGSHVEQQYQPPRLSSCASHCHPERSEGSGASSTLCSL